MFLNRAEKHCQEVQLMGSGISGGNHEAFVQHSFIWLIPLMAVPFVCPSAVVVVEGLETFSLSTPPSYFFSLVFLPAPLPSLSLLFFFSLQG